MDSCFRSTVRMVAMALVAVGTVCLAAESIHAQVIRPLTDLKTDGSSVGAIDDAGTLVFALSKTDPVGSNPLHANQILKWTIPGGSASQVGDFRRGATDVSVSDDGVWLAVVSRSDPAGQNHDLSSELFLVSSDGTSIVQLTNDPALNGGSILAARISGSGNRIVFQADTDPLGTNPGRQVQLFVIDTDGTGLTQLTSATGAGLGAVDISDDGSRIVFGHIGNLTGRNPDGLSEVFGILFDGTQLFQHSFSLTLNSEDPAISGDGSQIAFSQGFEIGVVNWGSTIVTLLGPGSQPSITDDAQFVYYVLTVTGRDEIFMISTAGGPGTQLTFSSTGEDNGSPMVSGANARVVFSFKRNLLVPEVKVMDANGSNLQQLTNGLVRGSFYYPDVTPDGSRIVFNSTHNLGTPFWGLYRVQSDGSDLAMIIDTGPGVLNPTISSDGNIIAFESYQDLTGAGICDREHIYRIDADGTELMQLSPEGNCPFHQQPAIAGDGSFVVFWGNLEGFNGGLYRAPSGGGPISVIVEDGDFLFKLPCLSEDDQWVAYHSGTNFDGLNPGGQTQVFRARTDGTLIERLTADPGFGPSSPDIDADGSRITYMSEADPLGTNPDQNAEIFLFDAATAMTQQLTVTTSGESADPRISGNGEFVYFISSAPFLEILPAEQFDFYRVTVATGFVERAAGLRNTPGVFSPTVSFQTRLPYVADHDGRAIVSGRLIATNLNFDENIQSWVVDFDAPARIRPGKEAPTLVSWDVEPAPVRYDVIRGDVANLQPGGPGETDLGPVVCIEDDSPDNDTLGSEDVTQPDPGQVLFYLHRGSRGMLAGPGSYDLASDGSQRVPASGDCQP